MPGPKKDSNITLTRRIPTTSHLVQGDAFPFQESTHQVMPVCDTPTATECNQRGPRHVRIADSRIPYCEPTRQNLDWPDDYDRFDPRNRTAVTVQSFPVCRC